MFVTGLQEIRAQRYEALHKAGLCQGYCPECQSEQDPEKAKAIADACERCDTGALSKLLFHRIEDPVAVTAKERSKQVAGLAVATRKGTKETKQKTDTVRVQQVLELQEKVLQDVQENRIKERQADQIQGEDFEPADDDAFDYDKLMAEAEEANQAAPEAPPAPTPTPDPNRLMKDDEIKF